MNKLYRSIATAALAVVAMGSIVVGVAGTASATGSPPWEPVANPPQAGALTFYDSSGNVITTGSTDAPFAAYAQGSNTLRPGDTVATLYAYTPVDGVAAGQWSGKQLSGSDTYPNADAPSALASSALPLVTDPDANEDLADYQVDFPNTDTSPTDGYAGLYVLRLYTGAPGKAATTSYDSADIEITGDTWSIVYPATTPTPTTTTLTTSVPSSQPYGTSVTLTATVTSGATGTVQFEDGSTAIGSPVTVTDGTASTTTSTLPLGTDALSAVFTADPGFSGSTGTASFTVSPIATTTTLTADPGSPQQPGTSVTLTATVSPAVAGSVQFENNTTALGDPVTVASGTATYPTSDLPTGDLTLNAVFTPTSDDYAGSTGSLPYDVAADDTATALSVDPTTAAADTAVTLTANVTDSGTDTALASGDGQVELYDNGASTSDTITGDSTSLGTVDLATGGVATLSYTFTTTGAHNIVAEFLPTDPSLYNSSTSLVVLFTATAPLYTPAAANLQVEIPAGTLTITTPYTPDNPLDLGTATLNTNDAEFTASGSFGSSDDLSEGVTITDTGIGDQPWQASAQVTNFTDGPDTISGQNLTFTGVTPNYISGNGYRASGTGTIPVQTTDVINDPPGGFPYGSDATGTDGLYGEPHQFADTATAGGGSVNIFGTLTLNAPTSAPATTYTATLTFTVA